MLFERIESEGLAHYSYLVGDRGEAFVVDPRRDVGTYVGLAARAGLRVSLIVETHRNEDYAVGSVELAGLTGAEVVHADGGLPYRYGTAAVDGQRWTVGGLTLRALLTPGHTPGSTSYVLSLDDERPWVVFTGDTLFCGDAGRCDLLDPARVEEMAGSLYDSLAGKILPLGDDVIVCPGHGPGSVCGAGIAARPFTTIGLERATNPKLALVADEGGTGGRASSARSKTPGVVREAFIAAHARVMPKPPYMTRMEEWNLVGAPAFQALPTPPPLPAAEFAARVSGAQVLDTRTEVAFAAAHIPGALSIVLGNVPLFAGWFLTCERPILLVTESDEDAARARLRLARIGFDDVAGHLAGGMLAWHTAAQSSVATPTVAVTELCRRLDSGEPMRVLDVRTDDEVAREGAIDGAVQIDARLVPQRWEEIPSDVPLWVFCGMGLRSMMVASFLQQRGLHDVSVALGGLVAWRSAACPLSL